MGCPDVSLLKNTIEVDGTLPWNHICMQKETCIYSGQGAHAYDITGYKQFWHPALLSTNIHKLVFNPWVDVHM